MARRVIVAVVCMAALALLTAGAGIASQFSPPRRCGHGGPAQRPVGQGRGECRGQAGRPSAASPG
jgi:hypothetical protein